MSELSSSLSLSYMQPAQAQKHVTYNETIRTLDSLVQTSVLSCALSTPPTQPQAGDHYIIPANATGDWAGADHKLAVWEENYWRFFTPHHGMIAWDRAQDLLLFFDGSLWVSFTPSVNLPTQVDQLGINAPPRYQQ